ncbi:MAG: galactokinase [Acidipropionibacterium acidipropionici]|uniref:galactokinase n=1 Tax=Acidipropionibacterium acidipropionici TaxID=1748 RepID=UPI001E3527FF|nr:galactokinase [Acidipropionibacterium acidipropionici]MDN6555003.1 galactokinase [Acidipropionibacterium acidipropionici]
MMFATAPINGADAGPVRRIGVIVDTQQDIEEIVPAWSAQEGAQRANALFERTYGEAADGVWASPGRVNIIGEHTDYNGGLCLPIALPHRTYVALRRRDDAEVHLVSSFDGEELRWDGALSDVHPGGVEGWVGYTAGIAWALAEAGHQVSGFDAALVSCVPTAAGLSSSAAVECAVGLALDDVNGIGLGHSDEGRAALVDLAVRTENDLVGAPTGGLDQAASLRTAEGRALLLDCRDGSTRQVPFDLAAEDLELLVIDTRAKHSHATGGYGQRRATCEAAAKTLGVATLREITDLDDALSRLDDDESVRRVRHVVTEIARVQDFVALVDAGRLTEVGPLMNASHDSLRDDYEVSCPELDVAVDAARGAGAIGARMTGGGFGGCAISLVHAADRAAVVDAVVDAYRQAGFKAPKLHVVTPSTPGGRIS